MTNYDPIYDTIFEFDCPNIRKTLYTALSDKVLDKSFLTGMRYTIYVTDIDAMLEGEVLE